MSYFKIYKSQEPKDKVWVRVSRQVSKKAVIRNKIKRRIKEIIRRLDIDSNYIISAAPGTKSLEFADLKSKLIDILKRRDII